LKEGYVMDGLSVMAVRVNANMTQAAFAEKLRVSPALISLVESGQRSVTKELQIKIALEFGAGPDVMQAIERARESKRLAL
jgi:transcriptional regulator with XRE-family HTH domain